MRVNGRQHPDIGKISVAIFVDATCLSQPACCSNSTERSNFSFGSISLVCHALPWRELRGDQRDFRSGAREKRGGPRPLASGLPRC